MNFQIGQEVTVVYNGELPKEANYLTSGKEYTAKITGHVDDKTAATAELSGDNGEHVCINLGRPCRHLRPMMEVFDFSDMQPSWEVKSNDE